MRQLSAHQLRPPHGLLPLRSPQVSPLLSLSKPLAHELSSAGAPRRARSEKPDPFTELCGLAYSCCTPLPVAARSAGVWQSWPELELRCVAGPRTPRCQLARARADPLGASGSVTTRVAPTLSAGPPGAFRPGCIYVCESLNICTSAVQLLGACCGLSCCITSPVCARCWWALICSGSSTWQRGIQGLCVSCSKGQPSPL